MKNTILYYPTISIPNNRWLRKAILYWDEIGSIVPQRDDGQPVIPYSPEIQFLKAEGEFRPFRPDAIADRGRKLVQELESELVDIVLSTEFQRFKELKQGRRLPFHAKRDEERFMRIHDEERFMRIHDEEYFMRIHYDKVNLEVFEFLREAGLARRVHDGHGWYEFEKTTGLIYMALLAKYLADEDYQATTPGTNLPIYHKFNFHAKSVENSFLGLDVKFLNALPYPRSDVSLHDILHFKRRRRDQLLHFRQHINSFQDSLNNCESPAHARELIVRFANGLERELSDLEVVMKDSSIATIAGGFETLLKPTSPVWLATAAVVLGKVKSIAEVPISWIAGGTMIAGTILIGKYLIDKRNERRAASRNSHLSYILSGKMDKIIP
jgi:hypothetical protein